MSTRTVNGDAIKTWREGAELSLEQVAAAAGVSRQTIENWENGRSGPRVDQALKMVKLAPGLLRRLGLLEVKK